MTQDEILKLINSTGAVLTKYGFWEVEPNELECFAALVAAHEREACAKVVEESSLPDVYSEPALLDIAEAIRARGQE